VLIASGLIKKFLADNPDALPGVWGGDQSGARVAVVALAFSAWWPALLWDFSAPVTLRWASPRHGRPVAG